MANQGSLRRWGAVQPNRIGLQRENRVGLILYTREKLQRLAKSSNFKQNYAVDFASLLDTPIFV